MRGRRDVDESELRINAHFRLQSCTQGALDTIIAIATAKGKDAEEADAQGGTKHGKTTNLFHPHSTDTLYM